LNPHDTVIWRMSTLRRESPMKWRAAIVPVSIGAFILGWAGVAMEAIGRAGSRLLRWLGVDLV
jgi:hypothetical protein